MQKKQILKILIGLVGVCLVVIGIILYINKENNLRKYFIIQEALYYGDSTYARVEDCISAVKLGDQIGITDEKQQVYSIEGQNRDEWLCVRVDGTEYIYKEINAISINLEIFNATKIVAKDQAAMGGYKVSIAVKETVDTITSYIKNENLVNLPSNEVEIKQLNIYSEYYPGLCFVIFYLHDGESDECFLYDAYKNEAWTIGHELMEQL